MACSGHGTCDDAGVCACTVQLGSDMVEKPALVLISLLVAETVIVWAMLNVNVR